MTYRELRDFLNGISEKSLDQNVLVYQANAFSGEGNMGSPIARDTDELYMDYNGDGDVAIINPDLGPTNDK